MIRGDPRTLVRTATRNRYRQRVLVALLGTAGVLCATPAVAIATGSRQPTEWSAELTEALNYYRAGDCAATQALCAEWLARSRDPRVQRDASALSAMTMLHSPARADRLAGVTLLHQVARNDPTLLDRPECLLALGIAHAALNETATALDRLQSAADAFASRQQPDRLIAALVALAEAWAAHTEWEVTPPRFGVPKPYDSREATERRRQQVGDIRTRLESIPDSADALARVDLLLARSFIEVGDRVADGRQLLERIAAAPRVTPAVADAALLLAEHLEQQQRWADALALYHRLVRQSPGVAGRLAEQRLEQIIRPQIVLDVCDGRQDVGRYVPASVGSGGPVRLDLQVRNLEAVQVEVRQVALGEWLEARQGRLAEALLPVAGSLRMTRRLNTHVQQPHGWWQSDVLEDPLEFVAEPGAYVAIANAEGQGGPVTCKRLVIVSDLAASVLVGPHQALIWATARESSGPSDNPQPVDLSSAKARFWMFGSFVPTQPVFANGLARFALPPEARVLRDKRWVCLVEADGHLAFCQGELSLPPADAARAVVALIGGPDTIPAGQVFPLAGAIISGWGPDLLGPPAAWQIELRTALDEPVWSGPVQMTPAGIFSARIPLDDELVGKHLRLVLRQNQQVVRNAAGRFGVSVAPAAGENLVVSYRAARTLDPDVPELHGEIQAAYAWGTPLADALVQTLVQEIQLPTPENGFALRHGPYLYGAVPGHEHEHTHGFCRTDNAGRLSFVVHGSRFTYPEGPTALAVRTVVRSWERQSTAHLRTVLRAADPLHAWLQTQPSEPRVGEDVRLTLGWFDPSADSGVDPARLELRQPGQPLRKLISSPQVQGLYNALWRPEAAGPVEIVAHLPRLDGRPVEIRREIVVHPGEAATAASGLGCVARFGKREGVFGVWARLEGQHAGPLLVVVEDGDPLAAATLDRVDGVAELFLPLAGVATPDSEVRRYEAGLPADTGVGRYPVADARVLVAGLDEAGMAVLASESVAPDPARAIELQLTPPAEAALPGETVRVSIACVRADGRPAMDAMLVARLVPVADTGSVPWVPDGARRVAEVPPSTVQISSSLPPARSDDATSVAASAAADPWPLVEMLCAGTTLWATAEPAAAKSALSVPLPGTPGLYRLIVLARTPDGATATETLLLDTRGGLRVVASVPHRLTLGDRSLVAVMLENPDAEPVAASVRLEGGDGLHVESIRVRDQAAGPQPLDPSGPITVVVPPEGYAWVQARAEAVRIGAGVLRAAVDLPGGRQHAEASYAVLPPDAPAGGEPAIRIRRSVMLLVPDELRACRTPLDLEGSRPGKWQRIRPRGGNLVEPGQHLLIREDFELLESLDAVTWSQRLPPNCLPMLSDSQEDSTVGPLAHRDIDTLHYSIEHLAARHHRHEYHVVAVRPGVCRLPLPEVRVGGEPVAVVVEPAETLINVLDVAPQP